MNGVVAHILEEDDGNIRLFLDDVKASRGTELPVWEHQGLFTSNDYCSETFISLSLSKEQFAEIGESLVIRLLALEGHLK